MCWASSRFLLRGVSRNLYIENARDRFFWIRTYAEVIRKKTGSLTTGGPVQGCRQVPAKELITRQAHARGHRLEIRPPHLAGAAKVAHRPVRAIELISELRIRELGMFQVFRHGFHCFRRSERSRHSFSRRLLAQRARINSQCRNRARKSCGVHCEAGIVKADKLR